MPLSRRRLIVSPLAAAAASAVALRPALAQPTPAPGPCDDFYEHVNGAWLAAQELPADRARIGSFDTVRLRNKAMLESALKEALADRRQLDTPGKRLVADYYASGLDLAAIERSGTAPVQPLLAQIDALADRAELHRGVLLLAQHRIDAPLWVSPGVDARDKRRRRVTLSQGGLGLPDRDDYFRDDAHSRRVRGAYRDYLTRLLQLSGATATQAERDAAAVLLFETRLANGSLKRTEMRDPVALYNLRSVASLRGKGGGLDWPALIEALAGRDPGEVVVSSPGYIDTVNQLAREVPLPVWKTYFRSRLLDALAAYLPLDWQQAQFAYRQGALRGLQQRAPRSEEVIDLISGGVGSEPLAEGLGELFVARAFPPQAKARAVAMVEDIKAAMRDRIGRLSWMTDATKARAVAKLDAMVLQIGYPERWKRYEGLSIDPQDFAGNWLRAARYESARQWARLDQPVDRGEWFASPHIVNAFAGGFNNIVFPAGILQPPFFDAAAADATNFGGIGSVIGHEITHHFDDRGRQYDEVGNLADWWTPQDAAAYRERADRLAAQFSGFSPLPGYSINGVQTLGENISDLGGVAIAYDGLQRALARQKSAAGTPTPSQRFFLSYATIWRDKMRAEALITQLRSGQHSPARFRVMGPLSNLPAFSEAFGCPPGSTMQRAEAERITIW